MTGLAEQVGFILDTFEGDVFTDDPADPGGATRYGITQRTLQYYRRRLTGNNALEVKAADVAAMTRGEAIDIGVSIFAVESGLAHILDARVRFVALDYAFHAGWVPAIRALQTAVGVAVDGQFGPLSQNAVNRHPAPVQLGLQVLTRRAEAMQRQLRAKPAMQKFTLGWWARITTNQRQLAA